jgi:PAB-dependent poly(A)-specific ribonuclease subunit 2
MLLPGAGAAAAAAAAAASPRQQQSPQQQAVQQQSAQQQSTQQQQQQQPSPQQSPQQQQQQSPQQQAAQAAETQQQLSGAETEAIQKASDTLAATLSTPRSVHSTPPFNRHPQRYNWMVFNDFHITASLPEEVGELYGGQKLPCLLYYTQVEAVRRAAELPPLPPRPVLAPEGFLALCRMPPLQGPKVRLHKPTFAPLLPTELPQPGALFALDAEFVAYSPPEKALLRGVEVEVRPSRLGLARVSLLRGQGASKGTPCIDDYIKSAEPVYDYLTKFSGLVPGDLDPARSPHYLTTLKRAYLKLRYLVDAGAVFVGHGLKKDFRMINIVVPPSQIVDTVDLFHAKRSRKLSLRFLASYLLRSSIQVRLAWGLNLSGLVGSQACAAIARCSAAAAPSCRPVLLPCLLHDALN